MLFVREYLILHGQIHARAVHQIDDGQAVFHGYFLRAQVLFPCDGKPCTGFDRSVIGNDNTLATTHITYSNDDATRWTTSVFFVHFEAGKSAEFHKKRTGIYEMVDSFTGGELAQTVFFFNFCFSTSQMDFFQSEFHSGNEQFELIFVFAAFEFFLGHCGGGICVAKE